MSTLVGVRRALTGTGVPAAAFLLPLTDAGAGAVNLTATAGFPGTSGTFTRATSATTWSSAGLLLTVGIGVARSTYTPLTGASYLGYYAEEARTNQCLQCRDMTNASWTKVTMTAAKDQTGIDGAANSASSLLATGASASCLQTITEAATLSSLSMYLKRITGTGTVTIQQGASTSEVSGSINSSTWTRVELDATVLNPAIGIVLGTNGDKIAVDYVQFENLPAGGTASSPIATTTVAVTRNVDVLTYPTVGNYFGTVGTAYAEITSGSSSGVAAILPVSSAAVRAPLRIQSGSFLGYNDGTFNSNNIALTRPVTTVQRVAAAWKGAAESQALNGVVAPANSFVGDFAVGANFGIAYDGTNSLNGTIRNAKIWTVALTDARLGAL